MDIYIEVDEILDNVSRGEQKKLLSGLLDMMDINTITECLRDSKVLTTVTSLNTKQIEDEYNNKILGLVNNRFKLTTQEEYFVLRLSERINP